MNTGAREPVSLTRGLDLRFGVVSSGGAPIYGQKRPRTWSRALRDTVQYRNRDGGLLLLSPITRTRIHTTSTDTYSRQTRIASLHIVDTTYQH